MANDVETKKPVDEAKKKNAGAGVTVRTGVKAGPGSAATSASSRELPS